MSAIDEARLVADINGENGPELQAQATAWAEENGYEITDVPVDDFEEGESVDDAFAREAAAQVNAMERAQGRPFSEAEIDKMVEYHGDSDAIPDMHAAYDEVVGRDMRNPDDRQAVATERFMEVAAQQEDEDY